VPPLRERPEDIAKLIDYFLGIYRQRFNRPKLNLTDAAIHRLRDYPWPGNVRELRNYLERAAAISPTDTIDVDQIPGLSPDEIGEAVTPEPVPRRLEELEREHILHVLRQSEGNRERAAAILGISSRTLYRKLREYEYERGIRSNGLATER
jgi:two-component system response regulator HydG